MTYYTTSGFGASTVEQARTILLMAMLQRDTALAAEAHAILLKLS